MAMITLRYLELLNIILIHKQIRFQLIRVHKHYKYLIPMYTNM